MKKKQAPKRKSPEYRYQKITCLQCGKESEAATKRRLYCSDSCRSQWHRDNQEGKQRTKSEIEVTQIKAISYVFRLKEAVIAGDMVALSGYRQIEKILNQTAEEMRK